MTQPGPQRQYAGRSAAERRADRRSRLVDAGLQMFGTVGYAMAPVGRICKVANLSTRQYYEEFGSREAADDHGVRHDQHRGDRSGRKKAVAALGNATLTARVEAALRTYARSTASDLRSARVAYLEIVGVNPAIEAHRMAWRRRWVTLIGGVLQAAIERGEIADRDYRLAAGAFVGAANGLLQDWCATDDRAPLDDVVAELSRLADALTR
ncbi:TetR/AcrR family transcriptional regulator [Fodinicola feengrottensis]|uniref:TetR/AcrR family transcriptional regulator n=1 Tax=Fodinicola feengrottensis TaxID=435914 RepID=UPI0013D08A6A|nr:TetR/AcrR family transcriptional regulator [Fodinicola feengrottensis]